MEIDYNLCMSVRNKSSKEQCRNRKKLGEYCGKHYKCKNIIRVDKYIDKYTDYELFKMNILYHRVGEYKVKNLRMLIKMYNINVNSKLSRPLLLEKLREYFIKTDYYDRNINKIVKMQSLARGNAIRARSKCLNDQEIMTLDSKYEIEPQFFTKIVDINGHQYCFDIRTLIEILKTNSKNPYTLNKIDDNEILKINRKYNYLKSRGIYMDIEKDQLDVIKRLELRMVDIFHKFDVLDNYTDHLWFKNLNKHQLKNLYISLEDIWNYRSQLNSDAKTNIVSNGIAFNIPLPTINGISNKIKLQSLLLDEFERFATQGRTRDDKKLGVMLILTGLVEVSEAAAFALPYLIQVV